MKEMLATNQIRWEYRSKRLVLQQYWVKPFIEGGDGKWIDVPVVKKEEKA